MFSDDIEMEIPLSEHLPETVIAELKQISAWLLGCKSDMFLQDYIMIRSGLLLKSLIGFVLNFYPFDVYISYSTRVDFKYCEQNYKN